MNAPGDSRATRIHQQHAAEDLNMSGVDQLLNLLALVKNDGMAAFDEDDTQRSVSDELHQDLLHTFRQYLDDATLCMVALVGVKTRLAKKIRRLKRRIAPLALEHAIQKIPDDVLAHIFESGHQMTDNSLFTLRMSHVCRRFRQISLGMPTLWTRLASQHPIDRTKTWLSRSSNQDLQVDVCVFAPQMTAQVQSFLKLVGPHSDRWSRLSYFTIPRVRDVMREFGFTNFPRLRYIAHQCLFQPGTFLYKWKMPLLRQFDGFCSEFPKHASLPYLSQLTRMELTFSSYDIFNMSSLFRALFKAKNRQHLSLEFQDCGDEEDEDLPSLEFPNTPFHMESLKVILKGSIAIGFVRSLRLCLSCFTASVVDLSFLTNGDPYDFLEGEEDHYAFPHGSTIRLRMRNQCRLPKVLRLLLTNCETIQSIEFEMSAFDDDAGLSLNSVPYPSLRHIRFHNCVMFEEEHVEMLARTFLIDTGDNDFPSLIIISCNKISEDFILNLQDEVGGRLVWSV